MTQYVINIGALPNDGTGDPLRTAFNDVNLNFNQVWATGLVGSNIAIANNTILTTNTNGSLILNPNGVGNVIANAHVLPDRTRIRNLGAPNLLWDTVYAYYGNITVANIGTANIGNIGNLTIDVGNIHILGGENGYVLQTDGAGNLTWTAQTGGGGNSVPGGANNQVQFNDAGVFGGSPNFLFNKTSNTLVVFGNIAANNFSTTGNIRSLENIIGNVVAPGANGQVMYNRSGIIGASPYDFTFDESNRTLFITHLSVSGDELGTNGLFVGDPGFTVLGSDIVGQFSSNVANYSQINSQNISNSSAASGDYIITADNGDDTTHFLDLGMTSSTWDGTQQNSLGTLLGPNNGYLYVQDGNLTLGTRDGNTPYTWRFDTAGNLTLPGNAFAVNYANGNPVSFSGGVIQSATAPVDPTDNTLWWDEVSGRLYVYYDDGATAQWVDAAPAAGSGGGGNAIVDFTAIASNVIPVGNSVYNLGSPTNQWGSLYVSNATIYMDSVPIGLAAGNVLTVDGQPVLTNDSTTSITTTGNIAAGGLEVTGDGGDIIMTGGNISGANVISANIYLGDGGQLSNVAASTGNITFNDISIIGDGNIYLQPSPSNPYAYLDVYLTAGPDIHISSTNSVSNLIMGTDAFANVTVGIDGNVLIQTAGDTTQHWTFGNDGQTTFPTLSVDLHNGGVQSAQTLQFAADIQAVITGPTPTVDVDAQRLIIQGQRGNGFGEGGDVYVWAGDADTNGGDIKIYAGNADNVSAGYGGYVNIAGGSGYDGGGVINITAGQSGNAAGAPVQINAGQGYTDGGGVTINGAGGQTGAGGQVVLTGGYGGTSGGDIFLQAGQGQTSAGAVHIYGAGAPSSTSVHGGNIDIIGGSGSYNSGNGGAGGDVSIQGGQSIENTAGNVYITGGEGPNVDTNGSIYLGTKTFLPVYYTGPGPGEAAWLNGTRTNIGGLDKATSAAYEISANLTPTLCYVATSSSVQSARLTFVVQSNGAAANWEQFDVAVVANGSDAYVSVSNKVRSNVTIDWTTVTANTSASVINVYLALPAGQTIGYVNYQATEFNIMVD